MLSQRAATITFSAGIVLTVLICNLLPQFFYAIHGALLLALAVAGTWLLCMQQATPGDSGHIEPSVGFELVQTGTPRAGSESQLEHDHSAMDAEEEGNIGSEEPDCLVVSTTPRVVQPIDAAAQDGDLAQVISKLDAEIDAPKSPASVHRKGVARGRTRRACRPG